MSCYKYWKKISHVANELEKYDEQQIGQKSIQEILSLLDCIEEIAHDETIHFDDAKHILENEKMSNALKIIRRFYVQVGLRLEMEKAQEILESSDTWNTLKSFYFYERYQKLIQNENEIASFSPEEAVIFVGGGPLPLTLILLNQVYGLKGISIEIKPEIANISRDVLKRLNLDSEIQVVCGDEESISDLNFDILMIAALAEPKERVFRNIRDLVNENTKILYRTYSGMRAILYSPVTEKALDGFEKLDLILPHGNVNNTSVLVRKIY